MKFFESIDLFATFIMIPLSLWLGFTGRINWWIIIFVWLMGCELIFKRDR